MKRGILILLVFFVMMFTAESYGSENVSGDEGAYAGFIFDNSRVHTIDVTISEENREDQLANPKDKTGY